MLPLIMAILLFLIVLLKFLAMQGFAKSIGFFVFIDAWFIWLFAVALFGLMYSATKRLFSSILLTAGVTLILRLVFSN